ncbi:MAG: hypothetical protein ISS93_00235 [Candidatus Aenigmarchaeota archaeon]|nr:hypothetical protein [Candidatus Aenigmarchaeota archaeon]
MRAQVAFEYIVIVGLVIAFLVPVWSYIASMNDQATQSLSVSQAQTAAKKIVSAADLVYTQGPPTQITLDVFVPRGVQNATIVNSTVWFRVYYTSGVTDATATALGSLQGTLPRSEGLYKFTITAVSDYVNISY